MAERFAVIMAGGKGTRFWPQSREAWPKQFLPIAREGRSLLQATVDRIEPLIDASRILVVTSARHADATAEQLPSLPRENILAEPVGRNTAPCVGWAAATVRRRAPDAVLAVLPADPHIEDDAAYRAALDTALSAAEGSAIVTIGIQPTRPETGYGYVQSGEQVSEGVLRAVRFVEKPDQAKAERFVEAGDMLWNSGMFFFRATTLLRAVQQHVPDLHAMLQRADEAAERGAEAEVIEREYGSLTSISIDYGIMEKADDVLVVPATFGWHDVGGWLSAWELADKDDGGNAAQGKHVLLDSTNCYVAGSPDKLIAVIGAADLVIVDTKDALLVVPRQRAQEVRAVVDALRERGEDELL